MASFGSQQPFAAAWPYDLLVDSCQSGQIDSAIDLSAITTAKQGRSSA